MKTQNMVYLVIAISVFVVYGSYAFLNAEKIKTYVSEPENTEVYWISFLNDTEKKAVNAHKSNIDYYMGMIKLYNTQQLNLNEMKTFLMSENVDISKMSKEEITDQFLTLAQQKGDEAFEKHLFFFMEASKRSGST